MPMYENFNLLLPPHLSHKQETWVLTYIEKTSTPFITAQNSMKQLGATSTLSLYQTSV